jgi:hypothetical protein
VVRQVETIQQAAKVEILYLLQSPRWAAAAADIKEPTEHQADQAVVLGATKDQALEPAQAHLAKATMVVDQVVHSLLAQAAVAVQVVQDPKDLVTVTVVMSEVATVAMDHRQELPAPT